jgi:dihydroorotase
VCVFDPNRDWTLHVENMLSEGRNTPFGGWDFPARVSHTIFNGRVVYRSTDDD